MVASMLRTRTRSRGPSSDVPDAQRDHDRARGEEQDFEQGDQSMSLTVLLSGQPPRDLATRHDGGANLSHARARSASLGDGVLPGTRAASRWTLAPRRTPGR